MSHIRYFGETKLLNGCKHKLLSILSDVEWENVQGIKKIEYVYKKL